MSTQIVCDGCSKLLSEERRQVAITGGRYDGLGGDGLPDDEFHLCRSCAKVAFNAVKAGLPRGGDR